MGERIGRPIHDRKSTLPTLSHERIVFADDLSLRKYISEVLMSEDIDFIVYSIVSHWHAIGVDALVHDIFQSKGAKPSGVIVVHAHPKNGFVISAKDFTCSDFSTVRFVFLEVRSHEKPSLIGRVLEPIGKECNIYRAAKAACKGNTTFKKTVRVVSVVQPNLNLLQVFGDRHVSRRYRPMFSVIDEGVGAYMSETRWKLQLQLDITEEATPTSNRPLSATRKGMTILPTIYGALLGQAGRWASSAAQSLDVEYLSIFRKEHGKLVPNHPVVASYRTVLERNMAVPENTERARPLALLLTQPFSEYGQLSLADDLDLALTAIDTLIDMGFEVLLKPHPREDPNKYDSVLATLDAERVAISPQRQPVETLLPVLCPSCVIGYTSTALPVARALYDIPSISIAGILSSRTDSEYLRVTETDFAALTRDLCYKADSFEQLRQIVASVVRM